MEMDADLLRRYLEFYRDLGITTLYRREPEPANLAAVPGGPAGMQVVVQDVVHDGVQDVARSAAETGLPETLTPTLLPAFPPIFPPMAPAGPAGDSAQFQETL